MINNVKKLETVKQFTDFLRPDEFPYDDILHYCRKVVKSKGLLIEPEELVSDAYIKFTETGDLKEVKNYIISKAFGEIAHQIRDNDITKYYKREYTTTEHQCCTKCHEVKPANAFELRDYHGFKRLRKSCKECRSKYHRDHKKKTRVLKGRKANSRSFKSGNIPHNKGRGKYRDQTELHNKWVDKNREKWNAYMRRRRSGTDKLVEDLIKKHSQLPPYEFFIDKDIENYSYDTNKPKTSFINSGRRPNNVLSLI